MSDNRDALPADRGELIERAAIVHIERPYSKSPIPDLMIEFELSVAEACAVVRRVEEMRICRAAFA